MRLNKYLSEMGICSRREADRLIEAGKIYIDERKAVAGDKLEEEEKVYLDGKYIGKLSDIYKVKKILLAFNKPRGIVCTTTDNDRATNIVEYISYPERIYPIGRLDKDSEGLILLTNQGDLVNSIMKSSNNHEKEYAVTVNKDIDDVFLDKMQRGVYLRELSVKTKPCIIKKISKREFKIIITQGLNRQIRRMCGELGYKVKRLKRIRILNIQLSGLKEGTYRVLTEKELEELNKNLKG